MFFGSATHCNVCLTLEMENVPLTKKVDDAFCMASLKSCTGCHLVVYCNKEHQKLDWMRHRVLCHAAAKLMTCYKVKNPYLLGGSPKNAIDLEAAITKVKFGLRYLLHRELNCHEDEVTSFPQYCAVCYDFTCVKICNRCQAVSYCSDLHALQDQANHNLKCLLLQLFYTPYKSQYLPPSCFQLSHKVPNMHESNLCEAFKFATLKKLPPRPADSLKSYQLFNTAADFSCIGTICFGLNATQMSRCNSPKFTIFIVGASVEQELWFQEIHTQFFFLQYPQILQLYLYFIGPEVMNEDMKVQEYFFQDVKRCVHFKPYRSLFQDFTRSNSINPSLIISFNCGFSEHMNEYQRSNSTNVANSNLSATKNDENVAEEEEEEEEEDDDDDDDDDTAVLPSRDTWPPGVLSMLLTFHVPIFFTSYTYLEALSDFAVVMRMAQSDKQKIRVTRIFRLRRNPFRDLRPLRSWRLYNDDIYYRNGYIQAIYTDVNTEIN